MSSTSDPTPYTAVDRRQAVLIKVHHLIQIIKRVALSTFPYPDGRESLRLIESIFEHHCRTIEQCGEQTLDSVLAEASVDILQFHEIVGFLLRSTNVRNAYELYYPIRHLARLYLGDDVRVTISSEWEYSPYTYPMVFEKLPRHVFIGMPAAESQNALVVPLAGHEIGHSVWRANVQRIQHLLDGQIDRLAGEIERKTAGKKPEPHLFEVSALAVVRERLHRRAEELFCDLIGLITFGPSYILAFTYFLAGQMDAFHPYYPSVSFRARTLQAAAKRWGLPPIPGFLSQLRHHRADLLPAIEQDIEAAVDRALTAISEALIDIVYDVAIERKIPPYDPKAVDSAFETIRRGIPVAYPGTLNTLVNAGWRAYVEEPNSHAWISDVVLKSVELAEVADRIEK